MPVLEAGGVIAERIKQESMGSQKYAEEAKLNSAPLRYKRGGVTPVVASGEAVPGVTPSCTGITMNLNYVLADEETEPEPEAEGSPTRLPTPQLSYLKKLY